MLKKLTAKLGEAQASGAYDKPQVVARKSGY
jgi:hypothetical protein